MNPNYPLTFQLSTDMNDTKNDINNSMIGVQVIIIHKGSLHDQRRY